MKQFEYVDVMYQFKSRPEVSIFVTILNEFVHHYTGTKMYHVRLEHDGTFGFGGDPHPFVEYKTVTEEQLEVMYAKRKV